MMEYTNMKIRINENFLNIQENYLFSDINKRVTEYKKKNPNSDIIRLGIGDVTLPLPELIVSAMRDASEEMLKKKPLEDIHLSMDMIS